MTEQKKKRLAATKGLPVAPAHSARHTARREEVLATATRLINADQLTGSTLQVLATALGVAHNSLYHYFQNRNELYRAALDRTVALRSQALDRALEGEGPARERLLAYVAAEISTPAHDRMDYSGDQTLPEKQHARFRSLVMAHQRQLVELIEAGLRDESIASCDAMTRAIAIESVLNRFVSIDAIMHQGGASSEQVVDTVIQVLRHGLLVDGKRMPLVPVDARPIEQVLGASLDAEDANGAQMELILRTAGEAFNRYGFAASIPEMAARIGKSKTVFYQYAADKEELLFLCYLHGVQLVGIANRAAAARAQSPSEEILLHYRYLYRTHDSAIGPFPLFNMRSALKPQHRRVVDAQNNAVRYRGQRRIERGVADGWFRKVDAHAVQPLFGGMLYRVGGWYEPGYHLPLVKIAEENTRLLFEGLAPR